MITDEQLANEIYSYLKKRGFWLGTGPIKNWDLKADGTEIEDESELSDKN